MANNHIITRQIGNLRGISTDSIFVRPSNVADIALNLQRAPDTTTQIRRGYQCQIAAIGGMGIGTFDNPAIDHIQTVCVGMDGFLYNKLTKQIYFYYDGEVGGAISNITQAFPAQVTSNNHGLQTGAILTINNVQGMVNVNNKTFTITRLDANNYTLNGVNSTTYPAYVSGGTWVITFTQNRFLNFTIFTDPRYLTTNAGWSVQAWSLTPWGAPQGESITCNITVNRAAQISSNATNVNTVPVYFGHELVATDVIQFFTTNGALQQRNVISVTATSITFDGFPATVSANSYINQFFDIPFRKGFDVTDPFLISTFISIITNPTTGIFGLKVAINGLDDLPAAFLQIVEPRIIDNNLVYTMNYWYWQQVNSTVNPPLPGSANIVYQNSPEFENASMAVFNDVIYIVNGWDFPQKYDGQTVYRSGMPVGIRPSEADNDSAPIKPFSDTNVYQYAISYQQIDNMGNSVIGGLSPVMSHTVGTTAAIDVTVTNLLATAGNNWNTNGADSSSADPAVVYGPDGNGFYYDFVPVDLGFTLKIGDSAYYLDASAATSSGVDQTNVLTIDVLSGHAIEVNDLVYFPNSTAKEYFRLVTQTTSVSFTVSGSPVTVPANTKIADYKVSLVFGNVAIVNGNQFNVNTITVDSGQTVQVGDIVNFIDASDRLQRRNVTASSSTSITLDGIPVDVLDDVLIASENLRSDAVNLRRSNSGALTVGSPSADGNRAISNNLRINIYRTLQGSDFNVQGTPIYLVASIPNDSSGDATQVYTDMIADDELTTLDNYEQLPPFPQVPDPPPIAKYVKCFGAQMFYAGGERGKSQNADNVFFSIGDNPEIVPTATNFYDVPNADDEITGIGIAGSTLVTTKNHSLWATTGNFLADPPQIQTVQIAPGTNIGCAAHATICSIGTLLYFTHTNGVYAITENQLYPTDPFGNPIPLSRPIDAIFRETNFIPSMRYVLKRAVAVNYTKDNQYLLFLPCENAQSTIRTANQNSIILSYDYQEKNWYPWNNMNAAGGFVVINDNLFFQERRFSGVDGNTANLYKQHRFYRLVDHADHAGPQFAEWRSSWEDLGQPEVRKKFCRCILLMDRISELLQYNNPIMNFSSYVNRLPNLKNTIATITQVDNIRNSSWSFSGWGWNIWSGYQDSFITVNLKGGTVAKSMQVGFTIKGINMDIRLSGFQLEVIPENRKTVVR